MSIDATATDGNTRSNRGPKPAQVNPPRCRADPRLARERDASSPAGHERPLAHAALSVADWRRYDAVSRVACARLRILGSESPKPVLTLCVQPCGPTR